MFGASPSHRLMKQPELKTPRQILMTADTVGGVWTYALELIRSLAPYGVRVHLATMGEPVSDVQQEAASQLPNLVVYESHFRLEWMEDPWEDVSAAGEWLLDLSRAIRPDLVHLNGYAHGSLRWPVPRLVVGHSCVYSWFEGVRGTIPSTGEWARYHREVRRGLVHADAVTAPTAAMLQALRKHYGSFTGTRVVYNGRRALDFRPRRKQPFVLTAGRIWDEAKNIDALASVAPKLEWEVRVAGEEQHPDGGAASVDRMTPLGRLSQSELAVAYGDASIFCLPARYEPFGLCPLEAALAGCALVLGDIPTLREVWGDTALFVPPDDEQALEQALSLLIRDEAFRSRLAQRSHQRALTYTPEAMASGYLEIYDALLRPSDRSGRTRARTATSLKSPFPIS